MRLGIELISGVELTAEFDGREFHILGHFFRDDDSALCAMTAQIRKDRAERIEGMVKCLTTFGLHIDLAAIRRAFPRATLGRKHLAEWLTRTRQVRTTQEAFERFLGDGRPAGQVPKPRLAADEAIALVHEAGGIAGLAHPPYALKLRTLEELADAGLGAIEVAGPGIVAKRTPRLREWATRLNLVPIAGSDFHAPDRPGRWVGSITTPQADLDRLRNRALACAI
jgi:predicted metal-dependent phosphoesterase TrpH